MPVKQPVDKMNMSLQDMFFALGSAIGFVAILVLAKTVLVPLAFGLLIAFILYPICAFLERKGMGRVWSTLWSMVFVTLVITGILILFSTQIVDIVREFDDFRDRLNSMLNDFTDYLNNNFSFLPEVSKEGLINKGTEWVTSRSSEMLTSTLNRTGLLFTGITLTIIYCFLLLLYRSSLAKAMANFAADNKYNSYMDMLINAQKVGQQYVSGMFILMLILGVLNSIGLLALGIDYAVFFGFLAAFLAIIPYIGTTLGGALPTIYAFITYDSIWYPIGVVLIFWAVQFIEGNFLNPKIVGGNMNINALAAILALISGGLVWGIAGMILFLPFTAILKVVFNHYHQLEPISNLLGDGRDKAKPDFRERIKKILKR